MAYNGKLGHIKLRTGLPFFIYYLFVLVGRKPWDIT